MDRWDAVGEFEKLPAWEWEVHMQSGVSVV
jgi:hypothetical protein